MGRFKDQVTQEEDEQDARRRSDSVARTRRCETGRQTGQAAKPSAAERTIPLFEAHENPRPDLKN